GAIEKSYAGKNVKKVLLLDCSRIYTSPRLGILENGFAEALKDLQFKDENLFLLSSADVGQRGWVLPDLGGSAFGYFVCRGLEGEADGAIGGATDEEVTLDELYQYLRDRIGQQVQAQYMAKQTPILLPERSESSAREIRLTWRRDPSQPTESDGKVAVAWERIDALWRTHTQLKQSHGGPQNESTGHWLAEYNLRREPAAFYRGADLLSFEAFQQGLLRLEQLNDAGRYYTSEASALADSLEATGKSLQAGDEASELPAALALRRIAVPDDVQKQVNAIIDEAPKKPEELLALQQTRYEERAKAAWNYWLGWARLRSNQIDIENMRRTLDGVLGWPATGSVGDLGECDPAEIRFLRLLGANKYAPAGLFAEHVMALQSAILSRDLAEAAAWANEDDRVHYAVAQLVEQGDAARRKYEDQLFFRPSEAATGRQWGEAETQYQRALTLAVELTAALDARDQAWQDLPYLTQWLVLRHATETNAEEANARLAACKQLFSHTRQLAEQINRLLDKCLSARVTPDDETRQQLVAATAVVSQNLSDLMRHHRDAISDARQKGAENVLSRRQMLDLLTTPLLTGQDRVDLRKAFLRKRKVEALTKSDAQAASKSASMRLPLEDHPLLAFFGPDAPAQDTGGRLAGELRGLLKKRFDDARSNAETAATSAALPTDRVKLATAEQAARDSAALLTLSPTYGEPEKALFDPLDGLQRFDRHHALVWQASRALDDFWGMQGDPRGKNYFELHSEVALRKAGGLGPGEEGAAFKQLKTLLADRQAAAQSWAQLNVPNIKLPPGSLPAAVEAHPEISVKKVIPAGRASFLVQEKSSNTWQEREGAPFDQPLAAVKLDLPAAREAELIKWTAGLFYRGHVVEQDFGVTQKEPGQVIEIARAEPIAPRIWVGGGDADPGAITFIFDCSGSMGYPAPGGGTRMNAAKNAFRAALQQLSDAGNYRVSVWFFGHRLIYDGKNVVSVCGYKNATQRLDYSRINFPKDWCTPETDLLSDDVAQEWPDPVLRNRGPVVLNRQNLPDVLGLLDVVQPAGSTPLYLSIVRAVEEDVNLQI
ncbi:MAG TPA: vWA domain-containing protein, partial [Pirellulales bacterium]|nr:vWA domain-containing protein [Pirellulales bacterium]